MYIHCIIEAHCNVYSLELDRVTCIGLSIAHKILGHFGHVDLRRQRQK